MFKKIVFTAFKNPSSLRLMHVATRPLFFKAAMTPFPQPLFVGVGSRGFANSVSAESPLLNTLEGSQKKITAKTLCEITGTRYYAHNAEILFPKDKKVRVFDEND